MSTYRVAIIGTGRVGYQFDFNPGLPDNHAAALLENDRTTIAAGVNRGKEKLEDFGRRCGVDALYHDYRKMLEEVKPDICIITTHPELHCEMVAGCAGAPSTKAIICEKPMAISLDECDQMIRDCEEANVLLQINHNRRWSSEWNLAKQLIDDGAIGTFNHIYAYMDGIKPTPSWRVENEGSLLHDFTHYSDLMDLYAGELDWICGMAEQRRRPWAVEDFSAAFMKFKNGVSGLIQSAELTEYSSHGMELRGSTGVIRIDGERVHLFQSEKVKEEADSGFVWSALKEREIDHPDPVSSYAVALDELLDALEGKGTLRSDGDVGRRSLEFVMGIYESQLNGCTPVHFPVSLKSPGLDALRDAGHFAEREE